MYIYIYRESSQTWWGGGGLMWHPAWVSPVVVRTLILGAACMYPTMIDYHRLQTIDFSYLSIEDRLGIDLHNNGAILVWLSSSGGCLMVIYLLIYLLGFTSKTIPVAVISTLVHLVRQQGAAESRTPGRSELTAFGRMYWTCCQIRCCYIVLLNCCGFSGTVRFRLDSKRTFRLIGLSKMTCALT